MDKANRRAEPRPSAGSEAPSAVSSASTVPATAPLVSEALPVLGHLPAFVKDPVAVLSRGYAEHARAFRLSLAGRPAVVLLDPEHCKDILTRPEGMLSIAASYPFLRAMFSDDFYLLTHEAEYQRQRELYLPVFRSRALQAYVGVMEEQTQALIRRMGNQGEVELVRLCAELNLKIAARSFFGEELGAQFGELLDVFQEFSGNVSFLLPPWVRPAHTARSRAARRRLNTMIRKCLDHRRARPSSEPDFLQSLSESRYPDGRRVQDGVAVQQALGLVWAGQETTSGQLAWAVADLLTHPEHHPALLGEQEEHLPPGEPLTVESLHHLTYTQHLLYESERLHPLAFLIARKALRSQRVGPYAIPRGTMVMTSPYLVHRLPEYFPAPQAFRPWRYAEDPGAEHRLLGFGAGLHRCLGQRFARLEAKVVLTLLLRHYDMELLDSPTPTGGLFPRGLRAPCRVRYRLRVAAAHGGGESTTLR